MSHSGQVATSWKRWLRTGPLLPEPGMGPSEDPRDRRQALKNTPGLETSSGGKQAHPQAILMVHVTFVIDCARGKQLSLAAPTVLPQALGPGQGPVTPSVKTYIVFCGGNQSPVTQGTLLDGQSFAQPKDSPKPCRGAEAPTFCPTNPSSPQEVPKAKESPWKVGPTMASP